MYFIIEVIVTDMFHFIIIYNPVLFHMLSNDLFPFNNKGSNVDSVTHLRRLDEWLGLINMALSTELPLHYYL